MTTTVDETISSEQLIELAPPFLLRVGAALIDYIVFLLLPLAGLISERALGGMGFGLFSDRTIWLLACVIGFINCVILPQVSGQSLGKLMTGVRIVKRDGTQISRFALLVRQTLGYLITLATLGLGFLVCAILPSGRTLHDAITGSVTVRAKKTLVRV